MPHADISMAHGFILISLSKRIFTLTLFVIKSDGQNVTLIICLTKKSL